MKKTAKAPKEIWLVVQQGGSSVEYYLHTFDSKRDANRYRKECEEATYATSEPMRIPVGLEKYMGIVETIISESVEMR